MDLTKWENIIVEWANCLRLSDSINTFNDLKNNSFLFNLTVILKKDFDDESLSTIDRVTAILNEKYQNCNLNVCVGLQLEDISNDDLVILASLLLHYSCVIDTRETLTSPLCNTLSKSSQLYVKAFLELITESVSRSELFKTIQTSLTKVSKTHMLQTHALQAGDSAVSCSSPLQDFLRTPCSRRSKLKEKDKEITQLRHTIDLERFEKHDLQEEIKIEKEKNKKLCQQMNGKTTEIVRLRSQILELENQCPSSDETAVKEEMRKLRSEIIHLEKYIQQLENEQQQLNNDADTMKNKLKTAESECMVLQEKAFSFEQNYETLLEMHREKLAELGDFKLQCHELNGLLEELRSQKHSNDSITETFDQSSCGEAACNVIDVQFKETQKENTKLNCLLNECQQNAAKLNETLHSSNSTYKKLNEKYMLLQNENKMLIEKMEVLKDTENQLKDVQRELESSNHQLSCYSEENVKLKEKIEHLQVQICESTKKTSVLNLTIQSLNLEISKANDSYDGLQKTVSKLTKKCASFEEETKTVQNKYDKLLSDFQTTDFSLQSVTKQFEQLDLSIENGLKILEKYLYGSNTLNITDKTFIFNKMLKQLAFNKEEQINKIQLLNSNLVEYEKLNSKLKTDYKELCKKESVGVQECKKIKNELKNANAKANKLETNLVEHEERINKMKLTISDINKTILDLRNVINSQENTISDLNSKNNRLEIKLVSVEKELGENNSLQFSLNESLKQVETKKLDFELKLIKTQSELNENKDNVIKLKNYIQTLEQDKLKCEIQIKKMNSDLQNSFSIEKNLKQDHKNLETEKNEIENQLLNANKIISEKETVEKLLEQNLLIQCRSHQEKINSLNSDIDEYCAKINLLESELSISNSKVAIMTEKLKETLMAKENVERDLDTLKDDCNQRLKVLADTMEKIEQKLLQAKNNETETLLKLNAKCNQYEDLQLENRKATLRLSEVTTDYDALQQKIIIAEQICQEKDDLVSKATQDLIMNKLEVEKTKEHIRTLQCNMREHQININKLEEEKLQLNDEIQQYRSEINELNSEKLLLGDLNATLNKKYENLESQNLIIISELNKKKEELNDSLKFAKKNQEDTNGKILILKNNLQSAESKYEDLLSYKNTEDSAFKLKIEKLLIELNNVKSQLEESKKCQSGYLDELSHTQSELKEAVNNYSEMLQLRKETEMENESEINRLTENLHELLEKYNDLDKTYYITNTELGDVKQKLENLESEKLQIELQLLQQDQKYERDYNKCISDLKQEVTLIEKRETDLINKCIKLKENLKISDINFSNLNDEYNKATNQLALLIKEKSQVNDNFEKLTTAFIEIKELYGSLKQDYNEFIVIHFKDLRKLESDFKSRINYLVNENNKLNSVIKVLQDTARACQNELEIKSDLYKEKLVQNQNLIDTLKEDVFTCQTSVEQLIKEKIGLEKQLLDERKKFKTLKTSCVASELNQTEIQENIVKLRCANNILETGKVSLLQEIKDLTNKITEIQCEKMICKDKYLKEIDLKANLIVDLHTKISLFEQQLVFSKKENAELNLKLSSLTNSLEQLNLTYYTMEKAHSEEKNSQQILCDNLMSQNESLLKEITITKEEIKNVNEKLQQVKLEREDLQIEVKNINTKIFERESLLCLHEAHISEINSKLQHKFSEILEAEKEKCVLSDKVACITKELQKTKTSRDKLIELHTKNIKEMENNLLQAHQHAVEIKDDYQIRLQKMENTLANDEEMKENLKKLLEIETTARNILEIKVKELLNEKSQFTRILAKLNWSIKNLTYILEEKSIDLEVPINNDEISLDSFEILNSKIEFIQSKIYSCIKRNSNYTDQINLLENEKIELNKKILNITSERNMILQEREKLIQNYDILINDKEQLKNNYILKAEYDELLKQTDKYESIKTENIHIKELNEDLEIKLKNIYGINEKGAAMSQNFNDEIAKLVSKKYEVDELIVKLKSNLLELQTKLVHFNDLKESRKFSEDVNSFNIIIEDIQKQFLRCSKRIYNVISKIVELPLCINEKVLSVSPQVILNFGSDICFEEEHEKVSDCKERASDLLQQMETFTELLANKISKIQKENVLKPLNTNNAEIKCKDDDLKKKCTLLKQRLVLTDNAKSNCEKKLIKLREELKIANAKSVSIDTTVSDVAYKKLLHEHIQTKKEFETTIDQYKMDYEKLLHEYNDYRSKQKYIPDQIQFEKEAKTVKESKLENEIIKLREAYGNILSDNSKLDLENVTLRKLLEDRTQQVAESQRIKEVYERLLEENNKLRLELDTLKYKRNRDREALLESAKMEKNESKIIQEVRNEYEAKLEKMKDKMIQLYRDEINKEVQKHQNKKTKLTNIQYKESKNLEEFTNMESNGCEFCKTRDSIISLPEFVKSTTQENVSFKAPESFFVDVANQKKSRADYKFSTLPKSAAITLLKEDCNVKRNTLHSIQPRIGQNIEMEDEGDLFNNKYLADLKEGRCILPSGRESNASRFSELKWRNSLCPPHLKSSYPAEMQFTSPSLFKEEDIKSGVVEFDDSMSTRLLPSDKPRKKDIGTTSYKKPGPPTPSKNGGRMSLQGNEMVNHREVPRDLVDSKTPKRSTPNRLKALFMGRNSSIRDSSENQPSTPRSKRLSIFRNKK